MTSITPYQPDSAAVAAMDTPALRAELAHVLTITAESLAYLATIWAELERRGEDLSDLRHGLASYLPAIAAGELAAEAVVAFAAQRGLLRRITGRPLDEQRALAAGAEISVVVASDGGEFAERELPARALTMRQVAVVFDDDGRVRSPLEQRQVLATHKAPLGRQPRRIRPDEMRAALSLIDQRELQRAASERGLALVPKCPIEGCTNPAANSGPCRTHRPRKTPQH